MQRLIQVTMIMVVVLFGLCLMPACGSDDGGAGGGTSNDALTAPTDFTASVDATGAVQTSWEPGSGGHDMFMVMRVEQASSTTMMWDVAETETTYTDTTAESGMAYTYMVHARRGDEVSSPSNKVQLAIP